MMEGVHGFDDGSTSEALPQQQEKEQEQASKRASVQSGH